MAKRKNHTFNLCRNRAMWRKRAENAEALLREAAEAECTECGSGDCETCPSCGVGAMSRKIDEFLRDIEK